MKQSETILDVFTNVYVRSARRKTTNCKKFWFYLTLRASGIYFIRYSKALLLPCTIHRILFLDREEQVYACEVSSCENFGDELTNGISAVCLDFERKKIFKYYSPWRESAER